MDATVELYYYFQGKLKPFSPNRNLLVIAESINISLEIKFFTNKDGQLII